MCGWPLLSFMTMPRSTKRFFLSPCVGLRPKRRRKTNVQIENNIVGRDMTGEKEKQANAYTAYTIGKSFFSFLLKKKDDGNKWNGSLLPFQPISS